MVHIHLAIFSLFTLNSFIIGRTKAALPANYFSDCNASPSNIFWIQWYTKRSSKTLKVLKNDRRIVDANSFWNLISPSTFSNLNRIDLSLFRPDYEPNFMKLQNLRESYVISYKIEDSSEISELSACLRVFDKLIDATLISRHILLSKIFAFVFKRNRSHFFFQIFLENVKYDHLPEILKEIEEIIGPNRLKPRTPHITDTKDYSEKIVNGPFCRGKLSSNFKYKIINAADFDSNKINVSDVSNISDVSNVSDLSPPPGFENDFERVVAKDEQKDLPLELDEYHSSSSSSSNSSNSNSNNNSSSNSIINNTTPVAWSESLQVIVDHDLDIFSYSFGVVLEYFEFLLKLRAVTH